jgi:hypothetical protein
MLAQHTTQHTCPPQCQVVRAPGSAVQVNSDLLKKTRAVALVTVANGIAFLLTNSVKFIE